MKLEKKNEKHELLMHPFSTAAIRKVDDIT